VFARDDNIDFRPRSLKRSSVGERRRRGNRYCRHAANTCSPATGKRSTTKCATSAQRAARRISKPFSLRRHRTLSNIAKGINGLHDGRADFIRPPPGKEGVNATLERLAVMVRMIREYLERTGMMIGFKPAGGVSTAKSVLEYQILMKEELGREWLEPELFRIGASSLLADIERQLEHHVTGRYSAFHRHPVA